MKNLHHQVTKNTKFHQEKLDIHLVHLGELGDLVVRFFSLADDQES